jgi:hypothetical protein
LITPVTSSFPDPIAFDEPVACVINSHVSIPHQRLDRQHFAYHIAIPRVRNCNFNLGALLVGSPFDTMLRWDGLLQSQRDIQVKIPINVRLKQLGGGRYGEDGSAGGRRGVERGRGRGGAGPPPAAGGGSDFTQGVCDGGNTTKRKAGR